MLRSAQPSQFSTYPIQNIDIPTLLAELLYGPPMLLNVCDNFIYTFIILEYQISRSCFYTEYESMNDVA